jgi:hypothetical protein
VKKFRRPNKTHLSEDAIGPGVVTRDPKGLLDAGLPASPRIVQAGRTDQRADFAATVPLFVGLDRLPLGLTSRKQVKFWRFAHYSWNVICLKMSRTSGDAVVIG